VKLPGAATQKRTLSSPDQQGHVLEREIALRTEERPRGVESGSQQSHRSLGKGTPPSWSLPGFRWEKKSWLGETGPHTRTGWPPTDKSPGLYSSSEEERSISDSVKTPRRRRQLPIMSKKLRRLPELRRGGTGLHHLASRLPVKLSRCP